jgi:hypothetical protein
VSQACHSYSSYGINGVQAPLVGFLPMPSKRAITETAARSSAASSSVSASASTSASSAFDANSPQPTSVEDPSQIASHLTVTFATQLPNVLLPDPSYTTPPYQFSSAPLLSVGVLQTMGLANASAYTIMPAPTVSVQSINASVTTRTIGGIGGNMGTNTPESSAVALLSIQFGLLLCVAGLTALQHA